VLWAYFLIEKSLTPIAAGLSGKPQAAPVAAHVSLNRERCRRTRIFHWHLWHNGFILSGPCQHRRLERRGGCTRIEFGGYRPVDEVLYHRSPLVNAMRDIQGNIPAYEVDVVPVPRSRQAELYSLNQPLFAGGQLYREAGIRILDETP